MLHAAGITARQHAPEDDEILLERGIGFTNLVSRPTRRADELQRDEIQAGAENLREALESYRPKVVAYTGIGVYRLFLSTRKVEWGVQSEGAVLEVTDVVVPSPSGLNRITFSELVEHYKPLREFL